METYNTYMKTLPTIVKLNTNDKLQIVRADITQDLKLTIDLLNISGKNISEVNFSVIYKDSDDNLLFNGNEFLYTSGNLKIAPHSIYYVKPFAIDKRFKNARSVIISIQSLVFKDGIKKEYSNTNAKAYKLPVIPYDKLEKIHKILGPEIITYGENLIGEWRCVCGATNDKSETQCQFCERNKNFVLNNLTEPLINLKMLNIISDSEVIDIDNDQSNILTNLTQTRLSKVAPVACELETKRQNTNLYNSSKTISKINKVSKIIKSIIILIIFLIIATFGFKFASSLIVNHKISNANSYMAIGDYQQAIDIFNKVIDNKPEVKESLEKAKKLQLSKESYKKGSDYIAEGNFLEALKCFKTVLPEDSVNFSDSQNLIADIEKVILNRAKNLVDSGKKHEALDLINNYLEYVPESANALTFKNIFAKSELAPAEMEQKINDSIDIDFTNNNSRAEIIKKSNNLINTYQKVRVAKGNLRKSPSLEADIITVLPADSDLYVTETKVEGEKRIWCKVEAKNINTNEIFNGWISNNVIENNNLNIKNTKTKE